MTTRGNTQQSEAAKAEKRLTTPLLTSPAFTGISPLGYFEQPLELAPVEADDHLVTDNHYGHGPSTRSADNLFQGSGIVHDVVVGEGDALV